MSLDISPETEARLTAKALEQGLSVDALLERLLNDAAKLEAEYRQRRRASTTRPASRRAWQPSPPGHLRRCLLSRDP
jgi:hypothetical protein